MTAMLRSLGSEPIFEGSLTGTATPIGGKSLETQLAMKAGEPGADETVPGIAGSTPEPTLGHVFKGF
ncbi:hypothetical protein ACFW9N_45475 [Streptomyces sp. NPDC059496]|uniref:hypothetical protein n=1 Tax=Streptomyces sp. NPDC059496 TaxID=3346851 RepID=UPI0036C7C618